MAVVEARRPDGQLIELTEVNLTKSGLLIMITDPDGHQVLVHRYAWDGLVKAVNDLFAEEWLATLDISPWVNPGDSHPHE